MVLASQIAQFSWQNPAGLDAAEEYSSKKKSLISSQFSGSPKFGVLIRFACFIFKKFPIPSNISS